MEDYQGNAKKIKLGEERPEKQKLEPVVKSEVISKKKSLGRKFKDIFVEADFRSVARYVFSDVLLPAVRNTIVDASTKGIERMMYGESAMRRRGYPGTGPRVTYSTGVNRGYSSIGARTPPAPIGGRGPQASREDFILSSREDADLVLERMKDVIDQYEVVSVADLNELVGFPSSHIDQKWGWSYLGDVRIRQIREGYLIDLPPAEPIQ